MWHEAKYHWATIQRKDVVSSFQLNSASKNKSRYACSHLQRALFLSRNERRTSLSLIWNELLLKCMCRIDRNESELTPATDRRPHIFWHANAFQNGFCLCSPCTDLQKLYYFKCACVRVSANQIHTHKHIHRHIPVCLLSFFLSLAPCFIVWLCPCSSALHWKAARCLSMLINWTETQCFL